MIIETRRIIIRPMEKRDEDDYVLLECSFSFMKSLTESLPMNTTKQIILDTLSEGKIEVFSLDNRLDGQYVGYLCIKSKENGFELGINLMQRYRGQGYGPEAIKALTDYLYQSRHIASLAVHIEKNNSHSIHVFEKIGAEYQDEAVECPNILDIPIYRYQLHLPISYNLPMPVSADYHADA